MHPVKKVSQSHFYAMLQNPFYYGEYVYGGVLYKGEHIPMISKEEHPVRENARLQSFPDDFIFTRRGKYCSSSGPITL